jgi:hypothetical protein
MQIITLCSRFAFATKIQNTTLPKKTKHPHALIVMVMRTNCCVLSSDAEEKNETNAIPPATTQAGCIKKKPPHASP